jgi:alpha-D-xyloside xylohydrolase
MKHHNRTILFLALWVSAACCAAAGTLEELKPQITEVAPGVYRLRAGEPEAIVPSMVRRPAQTAGLATMPKVTAPPLAGIQVWRLARGIRIELPLRADEVIYGLGLQCKHLEQNGWRRTLYTASGDDNGAGMGHAPIPFYVSTAGYGVLVDSARSLTFSVGEEQRLADLGSLAPEGGKQKIITDVATLYGPEKRNQTSLYVDVPAARGVDVYLFAGPQTGDAIARYNLYSGGGCLPSLAGLGPHYIFGTMLDAGSVLSLSDEIKHQQIPVTTAGLEPGWQTHAYSSAYLWNTNRFPSDFGVTMRQRGYDLYLWCQLYIDPSSPLIPLLGARFGDFDVWHGLVPDLADPKAREIYGDFLAGNFIGQGIAGFKLDEVDGSPKTASAYQSWMFPDFASFPSGADGDQLRNLLGRLGVQAMDGAFRKENRRTFGMVRAGQAWSAPLTVALYSDEYNFGDYMRYNLSAGVQGLLWAPEIRNADNERDWALRIGAAALSAKMVYNGWQFPHLIWQQPDLDASGANQLLPRDNPYAKLARHFNDIRMALLPYLYQTYSDYHEKGIAPVRPLVSDWPEDASTWHLDDEWMLGADLLVAPLTDENAFSKLYRVAFTEANQFQADPGMRMKFEEGVLALDIADTHDGLPGASMEFDLKAGPCVARLLARGDIGRMGMRLRRVENGHDSDVGEMYKDDLQLDALKWKEMNYQFNVPAAGHYRLSAGKAYFQRLPAPRRLELRDVSFEQRTGNPRTSWNRMVYLPGGLWRDFWTGAPFPGGDRLLVTATAEHPPVFVRDNTLLPLAEPVVTLDNNTVFTVHLAAYGDNPRPCELREDDGTTFDYEQGKSATLTVHPDGTVDRPDHGQTQRYRIVGQAEAPDRVFDAVLGKTNEQSVQTSVGNGEATGLNPARDVSEAELKQLPGVTLISADALYKTSSQYGAESGSGLLLDVQDGLDAFAFHTASEPDANVVIDLKREREIVGVTILNRAADSPDIEDRAASLALWLSDDARDWRCVWQAGSAEPVWSFELNQPQRARYMKIGLRDTNFLHLKRVRIYGR